MQKIIFSIIIFSAILFSYAGNNYSIDINTSVKQNFQKDSLKSEYLIDGKIVTKEKFENFLSTLIENSGSWFCAELKNGGITGYDANDNKGKVYEVRYYYESGNSKSTIKKK